MEQQKQELRAYFFNNMYLQGAHSGIQSQHTTTEMFVKYQWVDSGAIQEYLINESDTELLYDWAQNHKTTIVLNGGMSGDLQALVELFESNENPYTWAFFKETEYALNGALTNVGIILPEKIYNYDKDVAAKEESEGWGAIPELTGYEMKIVEALRGKRLMS